MDKIWADLFCDVTDSSLIEKLEEIDKLYAGNEPAIKKMREKLKEEARVSAQLEKNSYRARIGEPDPDDDLLLKITDEDIDRFSIEPEEKNNKEKLSFDPKTGDSEFATRRSTIKKANFGKNTNSYLLLNFLVHHSERTHTAEALAGILKPARSGGEDSTPDRRIRDTIKTIRNKFKLKPEDGLFTKSGFGMGCTVEIIN